MTVPTWVSDFKEIIQTVLAGSIGFLSSYFIEAYKKRKSPKEQDSIAFKNITDAANDSVVTQKTVIDMLDDRLTKDRIYYNDLIDRSKKDCEQKIMSMKDLYDGIIQDLQGQILKGMEENLTLGRSVRELTQNKNELERKVEDLTAKLLKYETTHPKNDE